MPDDPKTLVQMVLAEQSAPAGDPWRVLLALAEVLDEMNKVIPEEPEEK